MREKFARLIDVKSIVTIVMTLALVFLLIWGKDTDRELLMLFSTSYGAIITYFFTRPEKKAATPQSEEGEK